MATNRRRLRVSTLGVSIALMSTGCSADTSGGSALKTIDPAALHTVVEDAPREMLVPGAGTHFRIASNTKTMTAALTVLLVQDGKPGFDDPVSDYVPGVPNDADPANVRTPREVLDIAFSHPPQFAPDAEYEYSNTKYALPALIVEKVGGKPLSTQMADRLFARRE